jgi:hypothetical protein
LAKGLGALARLEQPLWSAGLAGSPESTYSRLTRAWLLSTAALVAALTGAPPTVAAEPCPFAGLVSVQTSSPQVVGRTYVVSVRGGGGANELSAARLTYINSRGEVVFDHLLSASEMARMERPFRLLSCRSGSSPATATC